MFEEDFHPINPVGFFNLRTQCHSCDTEGPTLLSPKYALPSTDEITGESPFAQVRIGWSDDGIAATVLVDKKIERVLYPRIEEGDSVELFIDTRDVKTSGFNTRFCHHFFFLPEEAEGHSAGEVTHFRTDDSHPLCDSQDLAVEVKKGKSSYTVKIFVPSHCLLGYDPNQFDRIGFCYRINRAEGDAQHFSAVSSDFNIEQQPSLWTSVRLVS